RGGSKRPATGRSCQGKPNRGPTPDGKSEPSSGSSEKRIARGKRDGKKISRSHAGGGNEKGNACSSAAQTSVAPVAVGRIDNPSYGHRSNVIFRHPLLAGRRRPDQGFRLSPKLRVAGQDRHAAQGRFPEPTQLGQHLVGGFPHGGVGHEQIRHGLRK